MSFLEPLEPRFLLVAGGVGLSGVLDVNFLDPTPADLATAPEMSVKFSTDNVPGDHYAFVDWNSDVTTWLTMDVVDVSNNLIDLSSHDNCGTIQGDAHQVDYGRFGKAFKFDGSGDYISLGDAGDFDFTNTTDFTLSAWVYKTDGADEAGILTKGTNVHYALGYTGIRWQFEIADTDGNFAHVYVGDSDPADKWVHVVGAYDVSRDEMRLYIDGELKMLRQDAYLEDFSNPWDLAIGKYRFPGLPDWQGLIDDVMVFERALGDAEVAALYDAGASSLTFNPPGLEGAYVFQAGAAGADGGAHRSEMRTVLLDPLLVPPEITLNGPTDTRLTSSDTMTFEWVVTSTVDTSFRCDLFVDGDIVRRDIPVPKDTPFSISVSGLSDGSHTWSVTVWDAYWNGCISETRSFTVDTLDPSLSVLSPTADVWNASNDVLVAADVDSAMDTYAFIDWDDSLIGWWTADDEARDESGRDNNAGFMEDAHITEEGRFGKAFEFDGDGDYLTLSGPGEHPALDYNPDFDFMNDDSFTLSAWVYKLDAAEGIIIQKGTWYLKYQYPRWQVGVGDRFAYLEDLAPTDRWVHIVGVFDAPSETVSLYVDGLYRHSDTGTVSKLTSTRPVTIGRISYPSQYWNGKIDEVMVFNRALDGGEVLSLYDGNAQTLERTFSDLDELQTHQYQVAVVNGNGNRKLTAPSAVTVDVSDTSPRVTLDRPLGVTRSSSSTQQLEFSAVDTNDQANTSLAGATLYWSNGGSFVAAGTIALSGESDSGSFVISGLADGTYQWNVLVTDSNDNPGLAGAHNTIVIGPTDYYVATTGDDGNPGTIRSPFRTIQHAADAALAGDTVYVRGGTYRETVTPANSGNELASITFRPYGDETVVISGADKLAGWTRHDGAIYKADMPVDLGKGNNQVFVDNDMMLWARWPNTPNLDVMRPALSDITGGTGGLGWTYYTVEDPALTQPADFWVDATIHITYTPKYYTHTGEVTVSDIGGLTFLAHDRGDDRYGGTGQYYLTGAYAALDSAGEWYYDSSDGTIYMWVPGDGDPDTHNVEVKSRRYAFDLSDRSYINVEGFSIVAAAVLTDGASHHLMFNALDMKYVDHFTLLGDEPLEKGAGDSGFILDGHHNVLTNSEIQFSAGNCVSLTGDDNIVSYNSIHDANYMGVYCATVNTGLNKTRNNVLSHNALYNSGRDVVQHTGAANMKITHNVMYGTAVGGMTRDLGLTYAIATNYMGTEIAYNRVYDSGYVYTGFYFDGYGDGVWIHHNVISNVRYGLLFCRPIAYTVDHNTIDPSVWGIIGPLDETITPDLNDMVFRNNIFTLGLNRYGDGAVWANNIDYRTNPLFVNRAAGDYRLQAASGAVDAGVDLGYEFDIAGTLSPQGGAPDCGAYEWAPVALPGDVDGDGAVDMDDFYALRTNFGLTGASRADGDFTGDGAVDLVDLMLLRLSFGASATAPAAPEPPPIDMVDFVTASLTTIGTQPSGSASWSAAQVNLLKRVRRWMFRDRRAFADPPDVDELLGDDILRLWVSSW